MTEYERVSKWRRNHKARARYIRYKSMSKSFIENMAQPKELDFMAKAIRHRRNQLYQASLSANK